MDRDFVDEFKLKFSIFNFSDDILEKIIDRCIDSKKTEEENRKKMYTLFYKLLGDTVNENRDFSIIGQYINENFDISTFEKSVESLNNLSQLLNNCNIEINRDSYNKIFKESEQFGKCIKVISNSKELSQEEKFELLNEKSADMLDFYNYDNNYNIEEYADIEPVTADELDKELKDENLLKDPNITNDSLKIYLRDIGKIPLLTPEEEYKLTKLYRETHDKNVRDKIIEANLRLVVSVAKKMTPTSGSLSFLDLISAGNAGLIRAIEDYDPDQARFTTYARPWIYQKIRREIQDNSTNIRIPVHVQESIFNYNKEKVKLEKKLGREPNVKEIKKETGLSYEKINEYENNIGNTISFHIKVRDDDREGSEYGDFIADTKDVIPEEIIVEGDKRNIDVLFIGLSEVEKKIMLLRTGIYDGTEYTLDQIANILYELGLKNKKLTRERVRQLELKAIRKLKRNKENYDQNFEKIANKNGETDTQKEKATVKDVVSLLRNTDKEIMYSVINSLSDSHKVILNECFGDDIVGAKLNNPTENILDFLLTTVYPKLLYGVNKKKKSKRLRENMLSSNIFAIDNRYEKNDVEKQIDRLQPFERLLLNKFYDIYSGSLRYVTNITPYEKEEIIKVLEKIKKGLLENKPPKKNEPVKKIVTRNKLFDYFGLDNKDLVLLIIDTLSEEEKEFLCKWYGENYDKNPSLDEDNYKEMDKLERNKIFNKIKVRIEKYKKLRDDGNEIDIETFCRSKYINKCSKDNIYKYFENEGYTEEEIAWVISHLNENDKVLLRDYYGSDLKHPIVDNHMPKVFKTRVLVKTYRKMQKRLEKNRKMRRAKNND